MFQELYTKKLTQSMSKPLISALFLLLFVSCGKSPSFQEANKAFLNNKPGDKNFENNCKLYEKHLITTLYQYIDNRKLMFQL